MCWNAHVSAATAAVEAVCLFVMARRRLPSDVASAPLLASVGGGSDGGCTARVHRACLLDARPSRLVQRGTLGTMGRRLLDWASGGAGSGQVLAPARFWSCRRTPANAPPTHPTTHAVQANRAAMAAIFIVITAQPLLINVMLCSTNARTSHAALFRFTRVASAVLWALHLLAYALGEAGFDVVPLELAAQRVRVGLCVCVRVACVGR